MRLNWALIEEKNRRVHLMVDFKHVIKDEMGLHGRPAGQLVKMAMKYQSTIQIGTMEKMVDAKKILGVMKLTLKQGNELYMTFTGSDEEIAASGIEAYVREYL
jgi:phosphocarrier protein